MYLNGQFLTLSSLYTHAHKHILLIYMKGKGCTSNDNIKQKLNQKEENNWSYYLFQKEKHHKSTIKYLKQLKNQLKRLIGSVIQLLSLSHWFWSWQFCLSAFPSVAFDLLSRGSKHFIFSKVINLMALTLSDENRTEQWHDRLL